MLAAALLLPVALAAADDATTEAEDRLPDVGMLLLLVLCG
jgi:D-aminopeptidase